MPRIWSVFDADDRLVLAVSDDPGEFHFSRLPAEETDPIECAFGTMQCFSQAREPELLNHLGRSEDLDGFFARLARAGYKVRAGRPRSHRIARL